MTITRYTDGGPEGWMQSPTGEFVRYEDCERLQEALEKIAKHRLRGRRTQGALIAEEALASSRSPQTCRTSESE